MRVTFRFLGAIWVSTLIILAAFAFLQVRDERERLRSDLERRAGLLAESLKEAIEPTVRPGRDTRRGSRAQALRPPGPGHRRLRRRRQSRRGGSRQYARRPAASPRDHRGHQSHRGEDRVQDARGPEDLRLCHAAATGRQDRRRPGGIPGRRTARHRGAGAVAAQRRALLRAVAQHLAHHLSRPAHDHHASDVRPGEWTKTLKVGKPLPPPSVPDARLFGPLAQEVSGLARNLYRAQAAAEREAALRLSGEATWTEERLKQFVRLRFDGRPLFVVSNREPVSHVWREGKVHAEVPASGVVTALEPVMRACGGVWVAHASGDADEETADARGRIGLPTEIPPTRSGACGSPRKRKRATTTASPTRGCGPSATWCTTGRSSGPRTGSSTARQREVRRSIARGDRARRRRGAGPGLSPGAAAGVLKAQRPDARVASSGTSLGRTRRRFASVPPAGDPARNAGGGPDWVPPAAALQQLPRHRRPHARDP